MLSNLYLLFKKERKIEEKHAFLAQRDQERKERVVSYFCRRILGTENAAWGRNVCPTLEQSPGVHEEGQETSI